MPDNAYWYGFGSNGWTDSGYNYEVGFTDTIVPLTKNTNSIGLATPPADTFYLLGTTNLIDVTNIDTIKLSINLTSVHGTIGARFYLARANERATLGTATKHDGFTTTTGQQIVSIDVSSYTGEFYLALSSGVGNGADGYVYAISFE